MIKSKGKFSTECDVFSHENYACFVYLSCMQIAWIKVKLGSEENDRVSWDFTYIQIQF